MTKVPRMNYFFQIHCLRVSCLELGSLGVNHANTSIDKLLFQDQLPTTLQLLRFDGVSYWLHHLDRSVPCTDKIEISATCTS